MSLQASCWQALKMIIIIIDNNNSNIIIIITKNNNNNNNNNNHRGNKIDKLHLSANLIGNSERQHAVFHCVIHHRHGLNTKNNSVIIVMIIIILITRDSILKILQ